VPNGTLVSFRVTLGSLAPPLRREDDVSRGDARRHIAVTVAEGVGSGATEAGVYPSAAVYAGSGGPGEQAGSPGRNGYMVIVW
jgi:hypothetical protein